MQKNKAIHPQERLFCAVSIITASLLPAAIVTAALGTVLPHWTWIVLGYLQMRTLNLSAGIRNDDPALFKLFNGILERRSPRL